MKIKEIRYSQTIQVKQYTPVTLEAVADVIEGEDVVECYKKLANLCMLGYYKAKAEMFEVASNKEAILAQNRTAIGTGGLSEQA